MKLTEQLDPIGDRGKRGRAGYKRKYRRAERRARKRDPETCTRRVYFGFSS